MTAKTESVDTPRPCVRCHGAGTEPDPGKEGSLFRSMRQDIGMGVRELARRAVCSPAYVTIIESGESLQRGDVATRLWKIVADAHFEAQCTSPGPRLVKESGDE